MQPDTACSLKVGPHLTPIDDETGRPMSDVFAIGDNCMPRDGPKLPATAQGMSASVVGFEASKQPTRLCRTSFLTRRSRLTDGQVHQQDARGSRARREPRSGGEIPLEKPRLDGVYRGPKSEAASPEHSESRRGAMLTEQALVDRSNKSVSGFRSRLAG
jgi:hypothetical protein